LLADARCADHRPQPSLGRLRRDLQSSGFPGYNSVIAKACVTVGRVLREHGYRASWFGKNHNTPTYQASQAGPFYQRPMGFEYF